MTAEVRTDVRDFEFGWVGVDDDSGDMFGVVNMPSGWFAAFSDGQRIKLRGPYINQGEAVIQVGRFIYHSNRFDDLDQPTPQGEILHAPVC